MSQYIAGGERASWAAIRAQNEPSIPLSPEHKKFVKRMGCAPKRKKPPCACIYGDVMYGGRTRTDNTTCPKHDRALTAGEKINRAPDLRIAYPIARLSDQ